MYRKSNTIFTRLAARIKNNRKCRQLMVAMIIFVSGMLTVQFSFSQPVKHHMPKADLPTRWTDTVMHTAVPWAEYPRPQLRRSEWQCLNGWWDYKGGKQISSAKAPDKPISFDLDNESIHVPFCPESVLSGIKRDQEVNMWYQRKFSLPADWKGKDLLLHFEGVLHKATVFINGQKVGMHEGGYESFTFNITSYLHKGENTITVAAYDTNDGTAPSGKNSPRGDYTFTSGIWQSVWLEPVSHIHIQNIRLTPIVRQKRLALQVTAKNGLNVLAVALKGDSIVATASGQANNLFYLNLLHPKTWSPDHPFLYDLKLKLVNQKGQVVDSVLSYFGMRDIRLGKVNGVIRPLLNGQFVFQMGLLDQGYWPDGILTPPSSEALQYDMEITKAAGFNLIRKHMKTESKRFYYLADKLGLLVWQDMPAIWYQDKDTAVNRSRFRKELKGLIDDHYNSPSIIAWVPFNENWGAFDVKQITDWVKNYDSTRLVNGNSGYNNNPSYQKAYGDPGNGDFVDTHLYGVPFKPVEPDSHRAASLGEFGGVGLFVPGHMWPVENNAYRYVATKTALTDDYIFSIEHIYQYMRYHGLSSAIYTQTTDVEHEVNGILTYDRAVKKMNLKRIRKINRWLINSSKDINPDNRSDSLR
jgi:hypothetical protein